MKLSRAWLKQFLYDCKSLFSAIIPYCSDNLLMVYHKIISNPQNFFFKFSSRELRYSPKGPPRLNFKFFLPLFYCSEREWRRKTRTEEICFFSPFRISRWFLWLPMFSKSKTISYLCLLMVDEIKNFETHFFSWHWLLPFFCSDCYCFCIIFFYQDVH